MRSRRSKLSSLLSNVRAVTSSIVSPALVRIASSLLRARLSPVSGSPVLAKRMPFANMTDAKENISHAITHGRLKDSGFNTPETKDFPSEIDNVSDKKFFDRVPRSRGAYETCGNRRVISFFLIRQQGGGGNGNHPVESAYGG